MKTSRTLGPTAILLIALTLTACGGGSGSGNGGTGTTPPPPPPPPVTSQEAFRFLNQTTFGATPAEVSRLINLGDSSNAYARWIDAELTRGPSLALPQVLAAYPNPEPAGFVIGTLQGPRVDAWLTHAMTGDDQLRQRVAFALSQIMVTSQLGALQNAPFATADYYDLLMRGAFGSFRQLLEDVTLHPAMGVYLSMLGNRKANAATNIRPDENYAREILQLMSIGLVQLNLDGTPRLSAGGEQQPTYNQAVIEGFARAFTGWHWSCPVANPACTFNNTRRDRAAGNQTRAMQLFPEQHETGSKQLLSYTGATKPTLPPNQSGEQDLRDALDNIFNHPNVAPFISKQLIQKLVASNPSPAYVQRVATVFENDGGGRRGNLAAVVRAILLDTEARTVASGSAAETAGKVKEPLLRVLQLWRAYGAKAASGRVVANGNFPPGITPSPAGVTGQGPLQSPSVFNFFSPFFAPPGEIAQRNLVAPELQLATEYLNTLVTNLIYADALTRTTEQLTAGADILLLDTREEVALAADANALINRVAEKLLGSATALTTVTRDTVRAQVERHAATATRLRVGDAIFLIASSPEFAVLP